MTPDTMSKDETSLLVFFETCVVDAGGLVEGVRMNADDHETAKRFADEGLAELHRIPAKLLSAGPTIKQYTHWVRLTDGGFTLAHALRRLRAERLGPYAKSVAEELRDRGRLNDFGHQEAPVPVSPD